MSGAPINLQVYKDLSACASMASQSEKDACMIRLGYRVTAPNTYARGTEITPQAALAVAAFIPGVGTTVAAVGSAAGAVKQSFTTPKSLQSPGVAVAPAPTSAPAPSYGAPSTQTLLILGGLAIVALFALRH